MKYLLALLGLMTCVSPAIAAPSLAGRYITQDGDAVVTLAPCGDALCGRISKLLTDKPQRDRKTGRSTLGLTILSDFRVDGRVWKGKIYNPQDGNNYRGKLSRAGERSLKIEGCLLFLCQSQIWKPAR